MTLSSQHLPRDILIRITKHRDAIRKKPVDPLPFIEGPLGRQVAKARALNEWMRVYREKLDPRLKSLKLFEYADKQENFVSSSKYFRLFVDWP